MEFPGFDASDFDLFSIPDFPARMGAIRAALRPKLVLLGADLAPEVARLSGLPAAPHVAQHMRRRVNPPEETWVAFARDRKGYKRWVHFRVAVSGKGLRTTVFVEDDSDDRARFAGALEERAGELREALGPGAPVVWYTLGEEPVPHARVAAEQIREAAARLARGKGAKFQAGVPLSREEALRMPPERIGAWALESIRLLRPLYLAAAGSGSAP